MRNIVIRLFPSNHYCYIKFGKVVKKRLNYSLYCFIKEELLTTNALGDNLPEAFVRARRLAFTILINQVIAYMSRITGMNVVYNSKQ